MTKHLIDVREYPEYAAGHIQDSTHVPLGTLKNASAAWDPATPILLVCQSGRRAEQARQILATGGFQNLEVLSGGIEAWRTAGKPLQVLEHQPWSMERQVRVTAGSLVVAFVGLGVRVSPRFLIGAGLVGAGLVFAGVSNTCMMASVLGRLPWNRPRKAIA